MRKLFTSTTSTVVRALRETVPLWTAAALYGLVLAGCLDVDDSGSDGSTHGAPSELSHDVVDPHDDARAHNHGSESGGHNMDDPAVGAAGHDRGSKSSGGCGMTGGGHDMDDPADGAVGNDHGDHA